MTRYRVVYYNPGGPAGVRFVTAIDSDTAAVLVGAEGLIVLRVTVDVRDPQ